MLLHACKVSIVVPCSIVVPACLEEQSNTRAMMLGSGACYSCREVQYLCSDVGVAVSVPSHPGAEGERAGADRQLPPSVLLQSSIQLAHVCRDGRPQGLLHNVEPTSCLCSTSLGSDASAYLTVEVYRSTCMTVYPRHHNAKPWR